MAEITINIRRTEGSAAKGDLTESTINISGTVEDGQLQPLTLQITKMLCDEAAKLPQSSKP